MPVDHHLASATSPRPSTRRGGDPRTRTALVRGGAAVALLLGALGVACNPACTRNSECLQDFVCIDERCQQVGPQVLRAACGGVVTACGCRDVAAGTLIGEDGCASGYATVESCSGPCPTATQARCTCDRTQAAAGP